MILDQSWSINQYHLEVYEGKVRVNEAMVVNLKLDYWITLFRLKIKNKINHTHFHISQKGQATKCFIRIFHPMLLLKRSTLFLIMGRFIS